MKKITPIVIALSALTAFASMPALATDRGCTPDYEHMSADQISLWETYKQALQGMKWEAMRNEERNFKVDLLGIDGLIQGYRIRQFEEDSDGNLITVSSFQRGGTMVVTPRQDFASGIYEEGIDFDGSHRTFRHVYEGARCVDWVNDGDFETDGDFRHWIMVTDTNGDVFMYMSKMGQFEAWSAQFDPYQWTRLASVRDQGRQAMSELEMNSFYSQWQDVDDGLLRVMVQDPYIGFVKQLIDEDGQLQDVMSALYDLRNGTRMLAYDHDQVFVLDTPGNGIGPYDFQWADAGCGTSVRRSQDTGERARACNQGCLDEFFDELVTNALDTSCQNYGYRGDACSDCNGN